jgi:hypothetical protein
MTRALLVVALASVVAGCGGSQHPPPAAAPPPRLPSALAHTWAAQANVVAQALAGGDCHTARDQANKLRDAVDKGVAQGDVPARFQSMLTGSVDTLPDRIGDCHPAPPPPKHDHGKHKGHEGDQG